jgi:hypothetical protein
MRKMILLPALVVILAGFLAAGACAQEKKPEVNKAAAPKPAKAVSPKPSTGTITIPETVLVAFVDEPSVHFDEARAAYLKKDYKQAADKIRLSVDFIRLEMYRASGEDKQMLAATVRHLGDLAVAVQDGDVPTAERLDKEFARAEQTLARHHEIKAQEYWNEDDKTGAGQDLKAASRHLEHVMKYEGREAEAKSDTVITEAHDFGEKLTKGTAIAADKVGKAMQNLGRKIEEAGKRMWPPKK